MCCTENCDILWQKLIEKITTIKHSLLVEISTKYISVLGQGCVCSGHSWLCRYLLGTPDTSLRGLRTLMLLSIFRSTISSLFLLSPSCCISPSRVIYLKEKLLFTDSKARQPFDSHGRFKIAMCTFHFTYFLI